MRSLEIPQRTSTDPAPEVKMAWVLKLFGSQSNKEAETIQLLIDKKKCHDAVKKMIDLENKVSDDDTLKEVIDSLYGSLMNKMCQVVSGSIVKYENESLIQVIKAIKKQEAEDSKILKNKGTTGGNQKTPRRMKEQWQQWIEASVSQQIRKAHGNTNSCLSQEFCNMGKTFKKDLMHVIKNLSPHYPAEFNVCNLYAQCYHKHFVSKIGSIAENVLAEEDTHFLLCWIHNIYSQTILRDPAIQGHIDESKLESLLPPEMIRKLKRSFINYEVNTLKTFLETSLDKEAKRWKDRKDPIKVGRYYRSKLQMAVTQKYQESIERIAEISEEMSLKMAPHLGKELQEFLIRYQCLAVKYTQKKKQKCFRDITIANINCSWEFRNLLENKDLRIENGVKENLSLILHEFETLGYDALLQDMFMKLKSYFRKLCHGKNQKEIFSDIMKYVRSCIPSLKPLCQPCFQVVIGKIHFQVVLEYVSQLMENPVRFEESIQLSTVANQIDVNANRIKNLFESHNSQETWLNPLLVKLAEIIRLKKPEDIIHKLSELAKEYTDIGREHISAILHIKGNIKRSKAASVLKHLKDRTGSGGNRTNSSPLFSLTKPFPSEWLSHSKGRYGICCPCCPSLSEIYMTMKFIRNRAINSVCKLLKVDTPPKFYPHKPSMYIR